ncbi:MbnP family copper-binding protein [Halioxenophilus sp. WMMB6]|uniref:MbnP family copper-binding protein n=1 Tax=Halioxenophilus sp. WMMB6 TaxID=3073815 RepID=UPI00295EF0AA|nr:MbnP family copper-binding protein [Halioxenophilus sp. WMMB6]
MVRRSLLWVVLLLAGCAKAPDVEQLVIQPVFHNQPLTCQSNIVVDEQSWQLSALLFYLSGVSYQGYQGLFISRDQPPQPVALVGSRCQGSDHWTLPVRWQADTGQKPEAGGSLHFTLGVPFQLNHQNPLQALAPLADSDMFWTWQLGYKFLRLDVSNLAAKQHWALHLGSLGCQSSSAVRAPASPCRYPNRTEIQLDYFDPQKPIYLHLDRLFDANVLAGGENCMGDPESRACRPLFQALAADALFSQVLE